MKANLTFIQQIAEYVRERLSTPPVVATREGSLDVLTRYSQIALNADRMCEWDLVGSVEIVGEGKDYDILILASNSDARSKIEAAMKAHGFIEEGGYYPQDEFTSLRFNEVNALVTDDRTFFAKWQRAVAVCKLVRDEFGICDRPLRVAIHQEIMGGGEA